MERAFKCSAAMSQGTGTGHPLTFRCSKCKVCRGDDSKRGTNWFATGRVRGGAISRAASLAREPRPTPNFVGVLDGADCECHTPREARAEALKATTGILNRAAGKS
jgi:hypothetical protein